MALQVLCWLTLTSLLVTCSSAAKLLDDFGGIEADDSLSAVKANADAMLHALQSAHNANDVVADRTVWIPQGKKYYMMPVRISGLSSVTVRVDGELLASDIIDEWAKIVPGEDPFLSMFNLSTSEHILFTGHGRIDGQGHKWWVKTILREIPDARPHLIYIEKTHNVTVENLRFSNSPMYHIKLQDVDQVVIRGIDIKVDIGVQQILLTTHGHWDHANKRPTFPLNTDGIDPNGKNIHIYNISVENFDDVVAVKPSEMAGGVYANCTENVLVEHVQVRFGLGMAVGTVSPRTVGNCVRNVTFRHVEFHTPIKAIYIKTNPGEEGFAIIEDITYEHIRIHDPLWWPVYIGPQQQKQPDGSGPGCMLFPLLKKECSTQARVTIRGVTLRDVVSNGDLQVGGLIRCNATNPCRGFLLDGVSFNGRPYDPLAHGSWYCSHVHGKAINSHPAPRCFQGDKEGDPQKGRGVWSTLKATARALFGRLFPQNMMQQV